MESLNLLSRSPNPEDMQTAKNTTPKFASFRTDVISDHSKAKEAKRLANKTSDYRGRGFHKSTRRRHHSRQDVETDCETNAEYRDSSNSLEARDRQSENANTTYTVDRYGDPEILAYGSLDRYAVPKYPRIGAGSLVGLPQNHRIDRSISDDSSLVVSSSRFGLPKLVIENTLRTTVQSRSPELMIKPLTSRGGVQDLGTDFILLEGAGRKKMRRTDSGSESHHSGPEDDTDRCQFIEGLARGGEQRNDRDLPFWREKPSLEDKIYPSHSFNQSLSDRRREFRQKVDADPDGIDAWLGLISCEDGAMGNSMLSTAERHSSADIKISIYEKALDHIQDSTRRERLLLGLMQEASIVWDTGKLSTRWRRTLQDNPSYLRLWTQYLNFKQTAFHGFGYEAVRKVYLECVEVLQHARRRLTAGGDEHSRLCDIQLYVLLRMTLFMNEAGFTEHAIATWQALLEFKFFVPSPYQEKNPISSPQQWKELMDAFEDFWDSEVLRIGEDGSKGWAHFYAEKGEPPAPKSETMSEIEGDLDLFAAWVSLECQHSSLARNPARAIDEVEEKDPYRIILFSDIQPFLLTSPKSSSCDVVLDAFLAFCQLPPYRLETANWSPSSWWSDGFIRNQLLYQTLHRGKDPFDLQIWNFQLDQETMFAPCHKWFSAFASSRRIHGEESVGAVTPTWTLFCLRALAANNVGNDDFLVYCLAFELSVSPYTVRKTARSLLRKRSSSLRLYNAYAVLEYRLGDNTRGEDVIATALKMSKQLDSTAQRDSILLWRTQVWELLRMCKTKEAFQRLLLYTDGTISSGGFRDVAREGFDDNRALILRTEKALSTTRDHLLSHNLGRLAATAAECLILLTYLRNPSTIAAARTVFRTNLNLLKVAASGVSLSQEHLHQSFALLIYHHATHTSLVKPAEIRSHLADSIAAFPQNTIFLSLYAWNEARFRIDDRVRSIVRDVVLGAGTESDAEKSVIPYFFAIHMELSRGVTFGSHPEAIRATFERAVESEAGAHCAGLWKSYFLFELPREDKQKTKAIFYRGIRACPWAKELYMLAFRYLRDVGGGMGEAELRGVYELLLEKELRVHVELEKLGC
ncbi:MAG: hypothetical protein Q9217_002080 [Psora testacea]